MPEPPPTDPEQYPTRNPNIKFTDVELISDSGYDSLTSLTFSFRRSDGQWQERKRQVYTRGDGAVILPYDVERRTVLLSRQFRLPPYLNDHEDGMLIEAAAGQTDNEAPARAMRRESCEELGIDPKGMEHPFFGYTTPASVTERLDFFAAPYSPADRTSSGGGLDEEGEDIEVLELDFDEALAMTRDGRIVDVKTILLLFWAALHGPFAQRD